MKENTSHNFGLRRTMVLTAVAILALSIASSNHLQAQVTKLFNLVVDGPRPITKALEVLEHRHGWLITYEDPPYAHQTDVVDQAVPEYRASGKLALIPKGGRIEVSYSLASNPAAIVQVILDAHASRGNAGRFRLEQDGKFIHVVPTQVEGPSGQMINVTSILDVPITLADQERSGVEALRAICAALSQAVGTKVGLGSAPLNTFMSYRLRQSAANETARTVLIRTLEGTQRTLTWHLYYDPGATMYVLNVLSLVQEVPHPFGGKVRRIVP